MNALVLAWDYRTTPYYPQMEQMKITVTVFVDIPNPDQWTSAFGVSGAAKIREDVKDYIGQCVTEIGVFNNGEIDATIEYL